jgi:hypothetical protein
VLHRGRRAASLTVMPAKAGIQGHGSIAERSWIPAYAGMTA